MSACAAAGVVVKPIGDFKTAGAYQYSTIRTNVDILKMIQLGLTFCNDKGELPTHDGELCVWQFNFREFDPDADMHAPESVRLLLDSGIDFRANVAHGCDGTRFAELLLTSGVVLNPEVSWITFHAGYDFGCAASALFHPLCTAAARSITSLRTDGPLVKTRTQWFGICRAHGSLGWCPLPGPAFSASHLLFLECLCTLYPTVGGKVQVPLEASHWRRAARGGVRLCGAAAALLPARLGHEVHHEQEEHPRRPLQGALWQLSPCCQVPHGSQYVCRLHDASQQPWCCA